MLIQFLYDADKDVGDAGGEAEGKVKASDILNRYGKNEESALRLAELYAEAQNELYRLREQRRTLRQERDDLKTKLPAEGTVVLTKDDAVLLETYRAFGKPDEIKKSIEQAGGATAELATLKREKQIRAAAEAAGYKPAVLERLASDLSIEVRPVKDAAPLVVVVKDGQETALADYAKEHWGDFLPALEAKGHALAPDINAGARGSTNTPLITDDERKAAQRRYSATF